MTDSTDFPDRLSTNPKSPHYDEAILQKDVGIRFDGQEKTNVEEYCVSEGWVRVAVGTTTAQHTASCRLVSDARRFMISSLRVALA